MVLAHSDLSGNLTHTHANVRINTHTDTCLRLIFIIEFSQVVISADSGFNVVYLSFDHLTLWFCKS